MITTTQALDCAIIFGFALNLVVIRMLARAMFAPGADFGGDSNA